MCITNKSTSIKDENKPDGPQLAPVPPNKADCRHDKFCQPDEAFRAVFTARYMGGRCIEKSLLPFPPMLVHLADLICKCKHIMTCSV